MTSNKSKEINSTFSQHIADVQAGKINAENYVRDVLAACEKINQQGKYFNTLCEEEAIRQAKNIDKQGELAGLVITVKDNVCVKDVESTAGSRILRGYKPVFDATIISRLKKAGAIVIGKTSQDAFGFGSFNTNVGIDYAIPKNPHDTERTCGGSSGGAAGITQRADFAHVAIAESTGGSIENPAAFCGVIGFCPTYGRLSRYGLISYANSLDKIGLMSKKTADLIPVLKIAAGHDPKDGTSLKEPLNLTGKQGPLRVGIIKESLGEGISKEIKQAVQKTCKQLQEKSIVVEEVSLPLTFKYGLTAYYLISTAEASTNLAKLSGLRYGQEEGVKGKSFNEYFTTVRSKHFNEETKRRIILGTFARMAGYRDAYYIKATKVRTKIIAEYKELFKQYDILISPTMPVIAPKFSEIAKMSPLQNYLMDILTVGPNLAGIPHASIPIDSKDGMPIGLMAMADHLQEGILLQFLQFVEDLP